MSEAFWDTFWDFCIVMAGCGFVCGVLPFILLEHKKKPGKETGEGDNHNS
ncbi:hypothetical protein Barb4_00061 [Bacteroidales bacterium Barb4]|nr:hypothetical protein Barb4_00061 [Bacteroidales bacterium Barb4]